MRFVVTLCLLGAASGFQWMKDIKIPQFGDVGKMMQSQAKFGNKKIAVITGTSSGLGKMTARALLRTGEWHVVGAVRDLDKMELVAEMEEFNLDDFTAMECDLASFASVRTFCDELDAFRADRPLDRLVCNAAVYQPSLDYPKWTADDHEQQMQINFLSHFLLISKCLPSMVASVNSPRVTLVGSVTGNDNTVGGGGVYPIADLKDLEGLAQGAKKPISMLDGYNFNGAKGYKDSKLALMMMSNLLHDKYHRQTRVAFSSIYPGCIAESPLFREKRPWFRKYFPVFMKFVTGGFVSEPEAGQRLFQVLTDPRCAKSGVYWSWNGGPRDGRGIEALEKGGQIMGAGGGGGGWDSIYENDQSDKVLDSDKARRMFDLATFVTGAEWPVAKQPVSPCPTLRVIGAVTSALTAKEELDRMRASADAGNVAAARKGASPQPDVLQRAAAARDGAAVAASLRDEVAKRAASAPTKLVQ